MNQSAGLSYKSPPPLISDLARCLACGRPLRGERGCLACGRAYPVRDGIMEAIAPLTGRNQNRRRFLRWTRLGQVPALGTGLPDPPGRDSPGADRNPPACHPGWTTATARRARGRNRQRRKPADSCRPAGMFMASTSRAPSSRQCQRRHPGNDRPARPGPRPNASLSTTRLLTPAGRLVDSTISTTMRRPCAKCAG